LEYLPSGSRRIGRINSVCEQLIRDQLDVKLRTQDVGLHGFKFSALEFLY